MCLVYNSNRMPGPLVKPLGKQDCVPHLPDAETGLMSAGIDGSCRFFYASCRSPRTAEDDAMKKLDSRNRVKKKPRRQLKRNDNDAEWRQRLEDLSDKFDLVLPEMTARVAALEHLLREKQLVTRQDLISARAFVRLQEQ